MNRQQERKDNLFWRLVYEDGQSVDEPLDGGSIKSAWAGAVELLVVHRTGKPLVSVKLTEFYRAKDTGVDLIEVKDLSPIFYRIRGLDVAVGGKPTGSVKTLALVFGRAIVEGDLIAFNLWTLDPAFKIIDCPIESVDLAAIDAQVEAHHIAMAANDRAGKVFLPV